MSKLDEKTPVIQKSYDYDSFKFLKENRPIIESKIYRIKKSIEEDDQSPWRPIEVNKDRGIIDGQHQFKALELLKRPIYFVQNDNVELRAIALLNAFQSSWTMANWAHFYAKQGIEPYKICIDFAEKYKLSINLAIGFLATFFSDKHGIRDAFKDGAFTIPDIKQSVVFIDQVTQFRPFMNDQVYGNREFYTAFIRLLTITPYEQFKKTLSVKRLKIEYRGSKKEYMRQFEDILNFEKSKNLIRLY